VSGISGFWDLTTAQQERGAANWSGAFAPPTVEYLVVAGGGGVGSTMTGTPYTRSGGGGAGGDVVSNVGGAKLTIGPGTYNAVVGAGGAGEIAGSTRATIGGSSSFSNIFAIGGGGGGGRGRLGGGGSNTGGNGGSGSAILPITTSGFSGGTLNGYPGGGAGDSANGGNGTSTNSGNGGAGTVNSISGSSVAYGGGGGGGGTGGGGRGAGADGTYANGTANTGGGGGGGDANVNFGGNGGSGIVILRYPSDYTITIGAGLTGSTTTSGANKITTITAGSGNVSWAL